ncbi:MAG: glycoside hydrolase family 3 C-terminal domain-containing protein [Asgard group archaeon]|nr:glycoside hydrolase family 3 C-terminal domain-containing protein [Asgard group archaeon]
MSSRRYKRMQKKFPYYDSSLELEKRITLLLSKLRLKEKFALLSGRRLSYWKTTPIRRIGLPSLGMTDGPVGISFHSSFRKNTKFPASICLAATWDPSLSQKMGKAIAAEVRSVGRHVVLAPGINVDRTPLNGRTFEYLSEDPHLIKELAIPFVQAVQQQKIGACIKHYVANNQETNRHSVSVEIADRPLNEIYLRAFKEVIDEANPWVVMGAYNKVRGEYSCAHSHLLREKLIKEYDFSGLIISDWWATKKLDDPAKCLKAGLCLEMPRAYAYRMRFLKEAYKNNLISEEDVDFAIRRLLRIMFKVGLFDNPETIPKGQRNTESHQLLARKIAEQGIVLLKNENNLLPLDFNKLSSMAILGPNKDKKFGKFIYGGSAAVIPPYENTPLEALTYRFKGKIAIQNDPEQADVCLLFMGLNHDEGFDSEDADRKTLSLPQKQISLIKKVSKINPNTIVILINGSPLAMSDWLEKVPAILEAWYPAMEGGNAITNVLFGEINPSGKLPLTFPKTLADSPAHQSTKTFPGNDKVYYDEGIFVGYRYFDEKQLEPLFPFGYGLSYTSFSYNNFKIPRKTISEKSNINVTIDIKNTGRLAGSEIMQVYAGKVNSAVPRPPKELIGFRKIYLKSQKTKTINLKLPVQSLSYYDGKEHEWLIEKGKYTLFVGKSSREIIHEEEFTIK